MPRLKAGHFHFEKQGMGGKACSAAADRQPFRPFRWAPAAQAECLLQAESKEAGPGRLP